MGVFAPESLAAISYKALWLDVQRRIGAHRRVELAALIRRARPLPNTLDGCQMIPVRSDTASYQADPAEVYRVLLLYSGGLDTSVMLKWIRDQYDAEVVALTVNLGQPGEDYEVVRGKALAIGAIECHVVDAREEFARDYVAPRDQGQRDLRPRLSAVHGARPAADRQARRRVRAAVRLRHDRPRLHRQGQRPGPDRGDDRDARARAQGDRARCATWQMGRDEEVAYAREHGIPVKGGTEIAPYSIDDNLWGRSSEGSWIEDLAVAPQDDVFQLVTRPEEAPDEAETIVIGFERGLPVGLDGERLGLVELIERVAAIGAAPRRRDRRPASRTGSSA